MYSPDFCRTQIENNRKDGYWIDTLAGNDNRPVGLVAYGLEKGEINLYENKNLWCAKKNIQILDSPVAMDQADITKNGLNDIIICYNYGKTIIDCKKNGGDIVWLENPGSDIDIPWKRHYVGKSTAMHRLKIGHFTRNDKWEIIGMPIVSGPNIGHDFPNPDPVPVVLFSEPDDVLNADKWAKTVINDTYFHLIHGVIIKPNKPHLDKLLLASKEGINTLHYNDNKIWEISRLGLGKENNRGSAVEYYGSGGVGICKVKDCEYIVTIEPLHGNIISVYTQNGNEWKRNVIDVYGKYGEGVAHHILCVDIDGDGNDEFLVALRGPEPYQGVYYYKPVNMEQGIFEKYKVSDDSAARITVGDFNNTGSIDFATISYSASGYFEAYDPSINVFYNRFCNNLGNIKVKLTDNKLNFVVPRCNSTLVRNVLPFIKIRNINIYLEYIPSGYVRYVNANTCVKVLLGTIMWTNKRTGKLEERKYLCKPKRTSTLEINSSDHKITAVDGDALIIVMEMDTYDKVNDIHEINTNNIIPEHCNVDTNARKVSFTFSKVQGFNTEFYNMPCAAICFDNSERICNMQFWAAGKNVNCGNHDHSETDIITFGEVHACIINGTDKGGMVYYESGEPKELIVESRCEHGPLWDIDDLGKPVTRNNGTIVYPKHRWQSGNNDSIKNSYDIWIAFEFNPTLLNKFS